MCADYNIYSSGMFTSIKSAEKTFYMTNWGLHVLAVFQFLILVTRSMGVWESTWQNFKIFLDMK